MKKDSKVIFSLNWLKWFSIEAQNLETGFQVWGQYSIVPDSELGS